MRNPLWVNLLLVLVVGVQALCTLFFVWDIAADVLGLRRAPMAWEMRELLEIGAALGLVLGVVLGALLLVRTLRRNRAMESRLREVSGAFVALLEERFAGLGADAVGARRRLVHHQGVEHRRDRPAARHQRRARSRRIRTRYTARPGSAGGPSSSASSSMS